MGQSPDAAGPSLIVSAGAGGFFDPAAALRNEPIEPTSARLTSHVDDSAIRETPNCPPPDTVFDPDPSAGCQEGWSWQVLPEGLIYKSYLAGVKETRFAAQWVYERRLGWMWDVAVGGRMGLLRYGSRAGPRPEGWQIDFEGAVFPRIEAGSLDVTAMDFRYGVPLTYGRGRHRTKLAFYHLSSHLADEFMLANPRVPRINYLRDALVLGHSFYWRNNLRLYAEAAYAYRVDGGAEPWEFQFGIDYNAAMPTGFRPVPFFAVNGHLRQEVEFGGNLTVQVGYLWRGTTGHLFRLGLQYFAGKSDQFEFFDRYEDKIGLGVWYDY